MTLKTAVLFPKKRKARQGPHEKSRISRFLSVKSITNVTTKHGFVGAGFKPAQDGSVTNRANFPPQGGFETRPYDTCGFFILRGSNCHES